MPTYGGTAPSHLPATATVDSDTLRSIRHRGDIEEWRGQGWLVAHGCSRHPRGLVTLGPAFCSARRASTCSSTNARKPGAVRDRALGRAMGASQSSASPPGHWCDAGGAVAVEAGAGDRDQSRRRSRAIAKCRSQARAWLPLACGRPEQPVLPERRQLPQAPGVPVPHRHDLGGQPVGVRRSQ